jgi:hypothetical protein
MFDFVEEEFTEEEALDIITEAYSNSPALEELMEVVYSKMQVTATRNAYIEYGATFLSENAEMLSKHYPSGPVKWPKKYVDNCLALFGFTNASLKEKVIQLTKEVHATNNFKTITEVPITVLHVLVIVFGEQIGYRKLKDSAKEQLSVTQYSRMYVKYFQKALNFNVKAMEYTYTHLSNKYDITQSDSLLDWIDSTLDTCWNFYRNALLLKPSPKAVVDFLNRLRNSYNQNMHQPATAYYKSIEENKETGADGDVFDQFTLTGNTVHLREKLIGLIRAKDELYAKKTSGLYEGIAKLKSVKKDELYKYAQTIDIDDIAMIIDGIFYVFIIKEGNTLDDINSTKFIGRIKGFPTAVDRAIAGKPVIIPLRRKYGYDGEIVKAHICLVATFMMNRMNQIRNN